MLDWRKLRDRRRILGLIAGASAARRALTPYQRDVLARLPEARDFVRRTYGHITDTRLAARLEVDRGTLAQWRKDGILPK